MALRYINAALGNRIPNDGYSVSTSHSSTTGGDVSVAYDDTKVNSLTKLKSVLDALYRQAQSSSFFTP
jgi:hypothetical protein